MSDDNKIGQRQSREKGYGVIKPNSPEVIVRGNDMFVFLNGRMLPVDTSAEQEHGYRASLRGRRSIAGKVLRSSKSSKSASPSRPHALEASMYISSNSAVEVLRVITAYKALMRELGFDRVDVVRVEEGSVWVKIKQTYKKIADNRKTRIAAMQLVGLAEAATAEKFQADNTATHANAVANLAEKTAHMESFSFDSGPLQYVQWQDENGKTHGAARVVSSKDIAAKRLDEEIVKNPQKMLEYLREQPDAITAPVPSDE